MSQKQLPSSTSPCTTSTQRTPRRLALPSAAMLAASLLTTTAASASGVELSRGRAIELALRQNPQIAAARAVEAQAAAHGEQASAAGLPAISLIGAVGPSLTAHLKPGSGIESTRSSTDIRMSDFTVVVGGELQILQPLFTFGKISERKRAAALERKAREAQTDMTRADIAFEVAGLYEAYLFARDALRFFDEMQRWLQRTIESTEAELEAGTGASEQDLLRLNTAMGVVRMGINRATAITQQTAGGLVAYLALPPGSEAIPMEETLELLPTAPSSRPELVKLALAQRAEVRGLAAASGAFLALAEAEEAGDLPDFFAMGRVSAAYSPGRDWLDTRYVVDPLNHFVPALLVGARWQWNGGMAKARGAENRAQSLEMDHKAAWANAAVPAEVNRVHESVQQAWRDSQEAEKSVSMAKKWLVSASADYSVGLGDARNVTDAAESFVQLRLAAFDARFRHNVAMAELAKVTGTLRLDSSRFYPTQPQTKPITPSAEEPTQPSEPGTSDATVTETPDSKQAPSEPTPESKPPGGTKPAAAVPSGAPAPPIPE